MISQGTTLNEKLKDHCGGASKERGGQHDTDLVDVAVGEGGSGSAGWKENPAMEIDQREERDGG